MKLVVKSPRLVIFVTILLDMLGFGIIIPVLPSFSKDLGAGNIEVGGIAAVYSLMNFLFAPWWGMLSDKYGRRPIILLSIMITGASYVLLGLSNALLVLFVSRILSGIGSANISVAQAYLSDITPLQDRAKAMGLIGAAFGLGFIFGPVVGGWVAELYGTAALGFLAASLSFINFAMAWLMLPESLNTFNKTVKPRLFQFKPLFLTLQRQHISSLMIVGFVYITAFSMMQITAVLLWEEQYHLDKAHIGYLFGFIGLTSAIVQGGLIGKLQRWWGEEKMLLIGLGAMMTGLFLIPFSPKDYFFSSQGFIMALLAFGSGCAQPALMALLSRLSGVYEQGQVLGLNMSFGSLARVVGPLLGGVLYQLDYHLPFIGGSLLCAAAYFLLVPLHNRLRKISSSQVSTGTN